jgi:cold-inducible RNA-binding protein
MALKLFVGGLSWDTTDDSLKTFFATAGTVTSAKIITDKFSGKSRGFGFVEMSTDDEAKKAIADLNGKTLDGRAIVVNEAKPMVPRENRGFGGGGGGGYRGGGGGGRGDDRGGRNW